MQRSGLTRVAMLVVFGLMTVEACDCRVSPSNLNPLVAVPADAGIDAGPALPDVQIAPQALDFGEVVVHASSSLQITLTNLGAAAVSLTFSPVTGPQAALFTLQPPPGGTAAGLTLPTGAPAVLTVVYAPLVTTPATSTASFTISECASCTALPISLTGQPIATGLSITPNPLDFGFLPPGQSVTQRIQLSNIGDQPVTVSKMALSAGSPATAFALGSGAPTLPLTLAPGQNRGVPVVFTPPSVAEFTGKLTFTSDDPGAPQVAVPLTGTGGGPQIQCIPTSLAFGQAVVGVATTLQVVCTNSGQDVPGDSASTLQFVPPPGSATALLVPDDPAFAPSFDSPPPAAGLKAGQSVTIDVVYTPQLAQVDNGHLNIYTNVTSLPDDVIPLSGTAISLPPCDSVIAPSGDVVFGQVSPGLTLQLPFAIENDGVGDCLVQNLALTPSTPSVFTLPNGPVASQILGYPGNSQGTPTSLTVPVQFAPTAAGSFTGAVGFTISNPVNPNITVPLSGESGPSCLVISPTSLNFGTVNLNPTTNTWCASLAKNVQLLNTCATDIDVTSIAIGVGTGTNPEFVISGLPALPLDIPAYTTATFQVAFQPDSQGVKNGTAEVMIQQAPQGPYVLPLQGDAVPNGTETDSYTVTSTQAQVDLLIIMDNDDDGAAGSGVYPTIVEPVIPQFFAAAQAANIDYQMAVTDDDVCDKAASDQGYFEPCQNCANTTNVDGTATTVFTAQNPNAQEDVMALVGQHPNTSWACGEPDEQYFDAMYLALQPAVLAAGGPNQNFLRPNAYLAVLQIDDDGEDDNWQSTSAGSYLPTVQAYYNFLVGLKGDPALVSYSYLYENSNLGTGTKVINMVGQSGGIIADVSCTAATPCAVGPDQSAPDWVSALTSLWSSLTAIGQSIFPLNGAPVASSIVVTVNGVAVPATGGSGAAQWTYNNVTNAVDFAPAAQPTAGQTVTVTYTTACN